MCILREIFVSVITAFLTSKIIIKREKKINLNKMKFELYNKIIVLFDSLSNDNFLMFEYKNFIEPLNLIKAKVDYIASGKVSMFFSILYGKITVIFEEYNRHFSTAEEHIIYSKLEHEGLCENERDLEFEKIIKQYQYNNLIPKEELNKMIENLTDLCRKEIGNDRLRRQKNENKTD